MNDFEYNELLAASWRRKLTPAEEARAQDYLATHPDAQVGWEEDLALTRHLEELPDAPLSSNFTALVLQRVDAEARGTTSVKPTEAMAAWWARLSNRFMPRAALGLLVAGLSAAVLLQHQHHTRQVMAGDVREFMQVASLPGPEVFEDFDAIQTLQPVSFSTDDDLLAALQ